MEQRKFPYHLVNVTVPSLSSAENNYEKSNCKWYVPSNLAGLLALEKPSLLFNGHPNRFILTNGKHPVSLTRIVHMIQVVSIQLCQQGLEDKDCSPDE